MESYDSDVDIMDISGNITSEMCKLFALEYSLDILTTVLFVTVQEEYSCFSPFVSSSKDLMDCDTVQLSRTQATPKRKTIGCARCAKKFNHVHELMYHIGTSPHWRKSGMLHILFWNIIQRFLLVS